MFNQLPSYVEQHATAFDLMVLDVHTAWEKYKSNPSDVAQYRTEDLQELFNSVRS